MKINIDLLDSKKGEEEVEKVLKESGKSTIFHSLQWKYLLQETLNSFSYYLVTKVKSKPIAILPLFIKKTEIGNVINSLPFSGSYGGVCRVNNFAEEETVFECLISYLNNFATKNNCLTSTIIISPFAQSEKDYYIKYYKPDFIYERFAQVLNLSEYPKYNFKVRGHIKKAISSNVEICNELIKEKIKDFYNIYKGNMEYLNLNIKLFNFFENVVKHLIPENMAKFYFAYYNNKMISGLLVLKYKNMTMTHETVMDREYKHLQANSLLIDYALQEAKRDGYEIFNFGATENKECGVYKFKKSFGTEDLDYCYLTKIYCDLDILKEKGLDFIKENFKWYYVAPYEIFDRR